MSQAISYSEWGDYQPHQYNFPRRQKLNFLKLNEKEWKKSYSDPQFLKQEKDGMNVTLFTGIDTFKALAFFFNGSAYQAWRFS